VIHHRLLSISEGQSQGTYALQSPFATLNNYSHSLNYFGLHGCFASPLSRMRPPGIFFGHTSKIFHQQPIAAIR
jgi:hypothetical protein